MNIDNYNRNKGITFKEVIKSLFIKDPNKEPLWDRFKKIAVKIAEWIIVLGIIVFFFVMIYFFVSTIGDALKQSLP